MFMRNLIKISKSIDYVWQSNLVVVVIVLTVKIKFIMPVDVEKIQSLSKICCVSVDINKDCRQHDFIRVRMDSLHHGGTPTSAIVFKIRYNICGNSENKSVITKIKNLLR